MFLKLIAIIVVIWGAVKCTQDPVLEKTMSTFDTSGVKIVSYDFLDENRRPTSRDRGSFMYVRAKVHNPTPVDVYMTYVRCTPPEFRLEAHESHKVYGRTVSTSYAPEVIKANSTREIEYISPHLGSYTQLERGDLKCELSRRMKFDEARWAAIHGHANRDPRALVDFEFTQIRRVKKGSKSTIHVAGVIKNKSPDLFFRRIWVECHTRNGLWHEPERAVGIIETAPSRPGQTITFSGETEGVDYWSGRPGVTHEHHCRLYKIERIDPKEFR